MWSNFSAVLVHQFVYRKLHILDMRAYYCSVLAALRGVLCVGVRERTDGRGLLIRLLHLLARLPDKGFRFFHLEE